MNSWPDISKIVPNAHLFRAFNSLGVDVFANPELGGETADLFYAGPDGAPNEKVERLIEDASLRRSAWAGQSRSTSSTASCACGSRWPNPEAAASRSS